MSEIISLITWAVRIYIFIILLRFLLQMSKADFYNPISQFIVKVTHPLLKPLRQIIPSVFRQDTAAIVLAYLVQLLFLVIIALISNWPLTLILTKVPVLALLFLIDNIVYLFYLLFIGCAILSWIAPDSRSPAAILIRQITDFIVAPLRKFIPPIGIFDITPMVALFILILISNFTSKVLTPILLMGFN